MGRLFSLQQTLSSLLLFFKCSFFFFSFFLEDCLSVKPQQIQFPCLINTYIYTVQHAFKPDKEHCRRD